MEHGHRATMATLETSPADPSNLTEPDQVKNHLHSHGASIDDSYRTNYDFVRESDRRLWSPGIEIAAWDSQRCAGASAPGVTARDLLGGWSQRWHTHVAPANLDLQNTLIIEIWEKTMEKRSSEKNTSAGQPSRRTFIKNSSLLVAGGAVAGQLALSRSAHAFGSDEIKIGLVGCGGRGTSAAGQAMNTEGKTKLIAMADAFPDKVTASVRGLKGQHGDKVDVPPDRQFAGFDAYEKVLDTDVDLVILATPPGFRPVHLEAAVNAGKHVFMEKPVAVDSDGVRRVLAATKKAKEKNLALTVGLQRRHEDRYKETIQRLQDGAIGDIIFARAYWNGGGVWTRPRKPEQTEMEYQMRNWYYFNWLCGDHIVEQHIHNLDVINWLMDGYPISAQGQGGRQVRTGIDNGEIYDHHMVEFTYADGTKMLSQCRHIRNTWSSVSEHAHGTKGSCDIGAARILDSDGNLIYRYGRGGGGGHQQEHHDLFEELRNGRRPNEGEYGALSSMTAILGRMATYSGQMIEWDEALNSDLVISPIDEFTSLDDTPPTAPDAEGRYPIPMPGLTKTV